MVDYMKTIVYVFMCSNCGCSDDSETDRLSEAIRQMRDSGWKIGKDKNTCPNCQWT